VIKILIYRLVVISFIKRFTSKHIWHTGGSIYSILSIYLTYGMQQKHMHNKYVHTVYYIAYSGGSNKLLYNILVYKYFMKDILTYIRPMPITSLSVTETNIYHSIKITQYNITLSYTVYHNMVVATQSFSGMM
jgi:hypothetical protein